MPRRHSFWGRRSWQVIRRPVAVIALATVLGMATPAFADFASGVKAYEAGDYKAAFEAWLPLAEHGDVAAMRNLGHLYRWGQGVEADPQKAIHWYRRAAESGFSRAQANLGAIYLQGDGVAVDYVEAHKWFEAAARQGHAVAQYNLGLMYELGLGVDKNEAVALGWYNNAAKAGQPDALERLSLLVMRRDAEPSDKPTDKPDVPAAAGPTAAPAMPAPAAAAAPPPPAPTPVADPPAASQPAPSQPASPPPASPPQAAAAPPPAPEGRSLLGRFYSAISSGGGVSIPDLFTGDSSSADTPPSETPQPERRP